MADSCDAGSAWLGVAPWVLAEAMLILMLSSEPTAREPAGIPGGGGGGKMQQGPEFVLAPGQPSELEQRLRQQQMRSLQEQLSQARQWAVRLEWEVRVSSGFLDLAAEQSREFERRIVAQRREVEAARALQARTRKLARELEYTRKLIKALQEQLRGERGELDAARAMRQERDRLLRRCEQLERQRARAGTPGAHEATVRAELLELQGDLEFLIILIDTSASMATPIRRDATGDRWGRVKSTVRSWLTHLPVRNVALICFSDRLEFFPPSGYIRTTPPGRARLLRFLDGLQPGGRTDLAGAFARALQYGNDPTWLLVSDGEPTQTSIRLRPGERKTAQLHRLLRDHRTRGGHVPVINVLAMGDLFGPFGKQLMRLAHSTGGSWRAR